MSLHSIFSALQSHGYYLLMPLIAGLVGYVTKLLALEMMFKPIEFIGVKPPYFGWQGVVPRKAPKMATAATNLLLGRIFQLEELVQRLDPQRMMQEVEGPLLQASECLVREIGERYIDGFWKRLPEFVQRATIRRIQREIPGIVQELWKDICKDPGYYIDIKHLLVSNLIKDKALLNNIFRRIGKKEFVFFCNAGFAFGLMLGIIQLVCWLIWHKTWLMPAFGGVVGLVSDWIALQMLFRPLYPKKILGLTVQGRFIARQQEVARDYSSLISRQLLTPANLVEEILRGPCADRIVNLVQKHIKQATSDGLGLVGPLALYALGSERYEEIREHLVARTLELMPETSRQLEKYTLDALDINNTIISRMEILTPAEFEGLLRPAFKEDEKILILAGAVLGFIIGEIQVHLML